MSPDLSISSCAGSDASVPALSPPRAQLSSRLWEGLEDSRAAHSVHVGCRLHRFSHRVLWALFTSTEPLKACSQTLVVTAVGLTLSLFLVFQDGSYLAEFLLEKGYEVSPGASGIPRTPQPPASCFLCACFPRKP